MSLRDGVLEKSMNVRQVFNNCWTYSSSKIQDRQKLNELQIQRDGHLILKNLSFEFQMDFFFPALRFFLDSTKPASIKSCKISATQQIVQQLLHEEFGKCVETKIKASLF